MTHGYSSAAPELSCRQLSIFGGTLIFRLGIFFISFFYVTTTQSNVTTTAVLDFFNFRFCTLILLNCITAVITTNQ